MGLFGGDNAYEELLQIYDKVGQNTGIELIKTALET